jgi:hypothetical protein
MTESLPGIRQIPNVNVTGNQFGQKMSDLG